jgi:signal peptidase II
MPLANLRNRLRVALPVALTLAAVDCSTKGLAIDMLAPADVPHHLFGSTIRLTLEFNRGAAMGLPLGESARQLLVVSSVLMIGWMMWLLWHAPAEARWRRLGLGLILGGAVGNLASRLGSARGVVDFIDIGFGMHRFYVFNVADIGITCGAVLLVLSLVRGSAPEQVTP